jgi:hypothetical protein
MPAPDLSALADTAFTDLGAALKGAGVEADSGWHAIRANRQNLELGGEQTANTLSDVNAELFTTPDVKQLKTQMALDIFDSVEKASVRGMTEGFAQLRSTLEKAAQGDLTPADPTTRTLLRQDIDALLASNGGGAAGLLRLAADPKYAAEIAAYGPIVLAKEGMGNRVPEIMRAILASVPATTPKAQAARLALRKLDQASGHVTGITFTARQRVANTQPLQRAGTTR